MTGKMWKLQPSYTANLAERVEKAALTTTPTADAQTADAIPVPVK